MEMRDLSTVPAEESNDQSADPNAQQALERSEYAALVRSDAADQRTELYARLRNIIDNAAESIRALKAENATLAAENSEMSDRIGTLQQRIRAVTTDLANDEMALRQSAEALEQVLSSTPVAPPAARPTPITTNVQDAVPDVAPAPSPLVDTAPMEAIPAAEAPESEMSGAETPVVAEAETEMPAAEEAEAAMTATEAPEAMLAESEAPEAGAPEAEMPTAEMSAEQPAMDESSVAPEEASAPEAPTSEVAESDTAPEPIAPAAVHADGAYTLIAYPFVRFSDLGQFQAALQKLAGVHDVQVRRFAQGTLEMRIGYTGMTDLATTLRTLAADVEDVTEEEPYRLRVRLRTGQDG